MRKQYSTEEVAQMLGLHRPNLQRMMREGRIPAPPLAKVGPVAVRLWSEADVERARKALEKNRVRKAS